LRHLPEGIELMQVSRRERQTGQRSMFDEVGGRAPDPVVSEPEFDRKDLLAFEKELLGLYITAHPLDEHAEELAAYCTPLRDLATLADGECAMVGGRVKALRRVDTRRGGQMAFVTIEDGATQVEVTVFPRTLEAAGPLLCEDSLIVARVTAGRRNGESNFILEEVYPLEEAAKRSQVCMIIILDSARLDLTVLNQVAELLRSHPGPTPVRLCLSDLDGESVIVISAGETYTVTPSRELRDTLGALAGVLDVALSSEAGR
jgi:DNA polymerase-3 subunit alpha